MGWARVDDGYWENEHGDEARVRSSPLGRYHTVEYRAQNGNIPPVVFDETFDTVEDAERYIEEVLVGERR